MKPAGEWNRYTITLDGSQLKVILNGDLIQDLDLSQSAMKDRPNEGYISFQDEAKRIWYRNVPPQGTSLSFFHPINSQNCGGGGSDASKGLIRSLFILFCLGPR